MTVTIVVPLYNEEENVEVLHERLKTVLDALGTGYEIIYVDDGGRDNTLSLL